MSSLTAKSFNEKECKSGENYRKNNHKILNSRELRVPMQHYLRRFYGYNLSLKVRHPLFACKYKCNKNRILYLFV